MQGKTIWIDFSDVYIFQSGSVLLYFSFCVCRTVLLWSIHLSLLFAFSYFSFQISYLCLYLQEQAHKTVQEISLLVPLLIFLLHEGNSQTRFVAKLIKHCRPTHCSKEDVGLIKGGGYLSPCVLNVFSEDVQFESKSIMFMLYHFSTVIATEQTGKFMLGLHLPFDPIICPKST